MMKKRLTKDKILGASTYILVTAAFLVLQLLMNQGKLSSTMKGFLVPACAYIVLAVSLNLLVGICGELSLGHAGFMGIGAFSGVIVTALLAQAVPNGVLRLMIAMLVGGVLAGAIGFLIGIPVLRLRGDYLAIVTLAFGEIMKNIFGNLYLGVDEEGLHATMSSAGLTLGAGGTMIVSGPRGATGITKLSTFAMGFVLILFTLFVVQNLINSREGRAIKAVRDNRIAAESVGINVTAFRMKAFVVSAFLAGMAGALYAMNYGSITASKFNFNTSINILVFVVLGGMGNILGSIISATVLYILPEAMRGLQDYRMIIYAIVLILVMLFTWSPKVKDTMSVISDKISAAMLYVPQLLLHVSRPVRWDSDHVVLLDDETQAIASEIVRHDLFDRVHIGLDFFDASINRIAAWVIGTRNMKKALLRALLEPTAELRKLEAAGDYTARLALLEEQKSLPWQAVWEMYCQRHDTPTGSEWLESVRAYEKAILSQRG